MNRYSDNRQFYQHLFTLTLVEPNDQHKPNRKHNELYGKCKKKRYVLYSAVSSPLDAVSALHFTPGRPVYYALYGKSYILDNHSE